MIISMTNEEIKRNFARNIVKLRKNVNLNQNEFGELIHYSYKNISKWENEDTLPDLETMTNIAKVFNVTVDDLISERDIVHASNSKHNRMIITISSILLPYILALIVFTILLLADVEDSYFSFIFGALASAATSITLTSIFYQKRSLCLSIIYFIVSLGVLFVFLFLDRAFYLFIIAAVVLSLGVFILFNIKFKHKK